MQLQNLKNAFFDQKQSLTKLRKSIEAYISNGTIQRESFISSGPRYQQMKSHFTAFRGQKLSARYASYSKPQLHRPVTSDYIKRSTVVGVKPAMSRQVSRPITKDSFRLTPLIPISKERPSFSSHWYEVWWPSKEVDNPSVLNSVNFYCSCKSDTGENTVVKLWVVIVNDDQQDATILVYLFIIPNQLYMFRAMSLPIIALDCLYSFWCPPILLPAGDTSQQQYRWTMELQFHLIHDTSQQQYR